MLYAQIVLETAQRSEAQRTCHFESATHRAASSHRNIRDSRRRVTLTWHEEAESQSSDHGRDEILLL